MLLERLLIGFVSLVYAVAFLFLAVIARNWYRYLRRKGYHQDARRIAFFTALALAGTAISCIPMIFRLPIPTNMIAFVPAVIMVAIGIPRLFKIIETHQNAREEQPD